MVTGRMFASIATGLVSSSSSPLTTTQTSGAGSSAAMGWSRLAAAAPRGPRRVRPSGRWISIWPLESDKRAVGHKR